MATLSNYFKQANWVQVHREQLASVARATPAAMAGYAVNTALAIGAFAGVIPDAQLALWAIYSLGISAFIGIRAVRVRRRTNDRDEGSPLRSARSALIFAVLLALPWTTLATAWVGSVATSSEVVFIALAVGMAASGSVLLAPVPLAATIYVTTILVPLILKCLLVLGGRHIMLGALGISFLVFLLGLIVTNSRLFLERLHAVNQLKKSVDALCDAREETERVAMTDGLTGVANRRAFMARLDALNGPNPRSSPYCIFYLDLDRFKAVNDAMGHAVGDGVLKVSASRIEKSVRPTDLVARLGGDEFAIVSEDISDLAPACALAERLATTLAEPFQVDGQTIQIGASVGVAIAAGGRVDGDQLLQQADLAMYAAKTAGHGGYCIFEPDMQRFAEERRAIEIGLGSAIANGEFALLYQPIRHMATGAITGVECLIRWHHPTRGLLLPAQFLDVAEDIGMANEIGTWVIEEACRQAVKWPSDITVGVNLSPLQIASGDVTSPIEHALKLSGLPARRLELEITETSLLQSNPDTIASFRRLKDMGISIALDDFGTGFSSLGYLVNFPFNRIKIDRLFVSQLGCSRESDLIVRSIAQLANNLSCSVVAEGIETAEQHRRLRAFNVSHGQGFYLGRPMSAREISKLFAAEDSAALAESA
jgi:diguanylate cyclase (GGDEF)-like protein